MRWVLAIALGLGAGLADCQAGPLGIFGQRGGSCASGQCGVSVRMAAPAPAATPAPVAVPGDSNESLGIRRVRVRHRLIFRGRRGC